jgi:hypothetical protein
MTRRTKKVIIKEELVELTGDYKLAIVLNQMIYWSERVADFDKFIEEEKGRLSTETTKSDILEYQNGWIYKTAEDLAEECMITNSESTMRRYLDKLISCGWLSTRRNPKYKWDKTMQYRVNITAIQKALFTMGFALEGYRIYFDLSEIRNDESNFQNDESNFHGESSIFHDDESNFHGERAIPEITSEITTKTTSKERKKPSRPKQVYDEQSIHYQLALRLYQKILSNNENHKEPDFQKWANDVRLMLERDNRTEEQIIYLIDWCQQDSFWKSNILSTSKLREKFDQLVIRVKEDTNKKNKQSVTTNGMPRAYQSLPRRTEMLPDWFDEDSLQQVPKQNNSEAELETTKREIEEKLKILRGKD